MKILDALKTFFSVLVKFFSVVLIMLVIATLSFEGVTYYLTGHLYDFREKVSTAVENNTESDTVDTTANSEDSYNTVLFYTDEDRNYFDVRIHLINTKTGYVDILLLPSSSKISVSGSLLTSLKDEVDVSDNMVVLEDIYRSYGDTKYTMMAQVISESFEIEFSSIDVMESSGMEQLLAMADGVTVTLKNDITYRNKDNVVRILSAGENQLNVKQAVAYMYYTNGTSTQEVNRLENISDYMINYLEKALEQNSAKELYSQYTEVTDSVGETERDDEKILEAIQNLSADGVSIRILQGSESDLVYTIDSQKAKLQISGLMAQAAAYSSDDTTSTSGDVKSSKGYAIELYNAGYISGLAASWQNYLEEQGYTIQSLGNYDGLLDTTDIVVTENGLGQDFLKYFPNAQITVEEISSGADIRIYLGTDSAYMVSGYEDTRPEGVVLDGEEETEDSETEDTETVEDEY